MISPTNHRIPLTNIGTIWCVEICSEPQVEIAMAAPILLTDMELSHLRWGHINAAALVKGSKTLR
jgi:hypothetical protein